PTAWDHYVAMPERQKFWTRRSTMTYTKVGDLITWPHDACSAGKMESAWSQLDYDFLIEQKEPTIIEKFKALPLGAKFRFTDEMGEFAKVTDTRYVRLGTTFAYDISDSEEAESFTIEPVE